MKSMTGFGRALVGEDGLRVTVEVQGWNHRHLDVVIRAPDDLRPMEAEIRERTARSVARGRCEVNVRVQISDEASGLRRLDHAALRRFLEDTRDLVESGELDDGFGRGDLVRSPFLVPVATEPVEAQLLRRLVLQALETALGEFEKVRGREGSKLAGILSESLRDLSMIVERLGARRAAMAGTLEESLQKRLTEILPRDAGPLPNDRIAQELALLAERADVREELERLKAHLEHYSASIDEAGPHGRRLDFLGQELLRELNTVGSKSRDVETTRLVVEGKLVNEQLREQIQNVE